MGQLLWKRDLAEVEEAEAGAVVVHEDVEKVLGGADGRGRECMGQFTSRDTPHYFAKITLLKARC